MLEPRHDSAELKVFIRALANIAAVDGERTGRGPRPRAGREIAPEERAHLDAFVQGCGFSPDDPEIVALIDAELSDPQPFLKLVAPLKARDLRGALVRLLVEMACADGRITPQEHERFREAVVALGFELSLADDLIEWAIQSIQVEARERELMAKLV